MESPICRVTIVLKERMMVCNVGRDALIPPLSADEESIRSSRWM